MRSDNSSNGHVQEKQNEDDVCDFNTPKEQDIDSNSFTQFPDFTKSFTPSSLHHSFENVSNNNLNLQQSSTEHITAFSPPNNETIDTSNILNIADQDQNPIIPLPMSKLNKKEQCDQLSSSLKNNSPVLSSYQDSYPLENPLNDSSIVLRSIPSGLFSSSRHINQSHIAQTGAESQPFETNPNTTYTRSKSSINQDINAPIITNEFPITYPTQLHKNKQGNEIYSPSIFAGMSDQQLPYHFASQNDYTKLQHPYNSSSEKSVCEILDTDSHSALTGHPSPPLVNDWRTQTWNFCTKDSGFGGSPGLLSEEFRQQLRKGVSFTANVVGEAVRVSELRGVPLAPKVPKGVLDLSTAAHQIQLERHNEGLAWHSRQSSYANSTEQLDSTHTSRPSVPISTSLNRRLSFNIETNKQHPETKLHLLTSLENLLSQPSLLPETVPKGVHPASDSSNTSIDKNKTNFKLGLDHLLHHDYYNNEIDYPLFKSSLTDINTEDSAIHQRLSHSDTYTVSDRLLPPGPSQTTLDKLVLMTFNVGLLEYRLGGITWYRNPPFTKRRLYHIAPCLKTSGCDIVALQEVYDNWQAEFLIESLRVVFPFVARRTSGGTFSLHNGLMLMSRFPILHTAFHPFTSVTPIEKLFGSKGMLEVIVEVPTVGRVTFVNIHLASGAVDPESTSLEALRNEEILQVLHVCDLAQQRGDVPIIIGDLNAAPNLCSSNYKTFLEQGWRDGFLLGTKHVQSKNGLNEAYALTSWQNDHQNYVYPKHNKKGIMNQPYFTNINYNIKDSMVDCLSEIKKTAVSSCNRFSFDNKHISSTSDVGNDVKINVKEQQARVNLEKSFKDPIIFPYSVNKSTDNSRQTIIHSVNHSTCHPKVSTRNQMKIHHTLLKQPNWTDKTAHYSSTLSHSLSNYVNSQNDCHMTSLTLSNNPSPPIHPAQSLPNELNPEILTQDVSPLNKTSVSIQDTVSKSLNGISTWISSPKDYYKDHVVSDQEDEHTTLLPSSSMNHYPIDTPTGIHDFSNSLLQRYHQIEPSSPSFITQRPLSNAIQNKKATSHETSEYITTAGSHGKKEVATHSLANWARKLHSLATTSYNGVNSCRTNKRFRYHYPRRVCLISHHRKQRIEKLNFDRNHKISTKRVGYNVNSSFQTPYQHKPFLRSWVSYDTNGLSAIPPLEDDPFCTQTFTWDPANPLNAIGPHSECHGLRCDHIFLPPLASSGGLAAFFACNAAVMYTEPQVTVEGYCCGLVGQASLVTLSDHYAVRIQLERKVSL